MKECLWAESLLLSVPDISPDTQARVGVRCERKVGERKVQGCAWLVS